MAGIREIPIRCLASGFRQSHICLVTFNWNEARAGKGKGAFGGQKENIAGKQDIKGDVDILSLSALLYEGIQSLQCISSPTVILKSIQRGKKKNLSSHNSSYWDGGTGS